MLCFRTLWEATFQQLMKEGKMAPPGGARTSSWQMPFGATSAAHTLALNAQRHFDRYGTTRETLGWIALNQRANAALNPTAIYRDPMPRYEVDFYGLERVHMQNVAGYHHVPVKVLR